MATLRECASPDEMWDAWKAGLLVNKEGVQLCNYDDYIRQVDRFIAKGRLWDYDKDRLFILVEDEED